MHKISPFGDFHDNIHKTRCLVLCRYERYGTKKLSVLVLCLYKRRLLSDKALKPPLSDGLSNIALTTMSFMFFWRLITVIEGSLKKASHSFVGVQNGQTIFKDAFKDCNGGVIGSKTRNPPFVCFLFVLQKSFRFVCNKFINCRLHFLGFITLIRTMGFC